MSLIPAGFPCPLRTMTGLDCPLCGATRATFALMRGDVATALDFNAMYVSAIPLLAALALVWLLRRSLPKWLVEGAGPWVIIVIAVAFAVVRNLPFEPFAVLGSTPATQ